jgi:hypothetical protein
VGVERGDLVVSDSKFLVVGDTITIVGSTFHPAINWLPFGVKRVIAWAARKLGVNVFVFRGPDKEKMTVVGIDDEALTIQVEERE